MRRLGWLKLKAMGPGLMDPPEVSVQDLREDLGPSGAGIQRDDLSGNDRGGPIAPAFVCHRALFQSDEGHTQALVRKSGATEGQRKR